MNTGRNITELKAEPIAELTSFDISVDFRPIQGSRRYTGHFCGPYVGDFSKLASFLFITALITKIGYPFSSSRCLMLFNSCASIQGEHIFTALCTNNDIKFLFVFSAQKESHR